MSQTQDARAVLPQMGDEGADVLTGRAELAAALGAAATRAEDNRNIDVVLHIPVNVTVVLEEGNSRFGISLTEVVAGGVPDRAA